MQKRLLSATKNRAIALENVAIELLFFLNAKNVAKRRRKGRELLHILHLQVQNMQQSYGASLKNVALEEEIVAVEEKNVAIEIEMLHFLPLTKSRGQGTSDTLHEFGGLFAPFCNSIES